MGHSEALRKRLEKGIQLIDAYSDLQNTRESLEEVWLKSEEPYKDMLREAYAALLNSIQKVRATIDKKGYDDAMTKYNRDLSNHRDFWEAKKPKREHYENDDAYNKAYSQWNFTYSMDEPNKPGYDRANND